jgi:hypothetical protein
MSRYYSIRAIETFIEKYCDDCLYSSGSVVGLGNCIYAMKNGRFFIVREHVLNCWQSAHTVRQVSKLSARQLKLIDDPEHNELLQDEE